MGTVVIQPCISGSKQKNTKTKFLRCTGYLNSIKPYKARFIAHSSSCTTSNLITSCLTAVKSILSSTVKKVYERSGKNLFWSITNLIWLNFR